MPRHLIIGGGTAGMNAIRTIREEESERSEITLVSAEKPYSRMVLPYYLDRSIAESHVYTATAKVLAGWGVKTHLGRRAVHHGGVDHSLHTAVVCVHHRGTRAAPSTAASAAAESIHRPPVRAAQPHRAWSERSRGR